jgi:hypothetical protein
MTYYSSAERLLPSELRIIIEKKKKKKMNEYKLMRFLTTTTAYCHIAAVPFFSSFFSFVQKNYTQTIIIKNKNQKKKSQSFIVKHQHTN